MPSNSFGESSCTAAACIEAFVDLIPVAKRLGQVSPGTSRAHAVQHALHGYSSITLVVDGLAQQNFPQLRPMPITEQ